VLAGGGGGGAGVWWLAPTPTIAPTHPICLPPTAPRVTTTPQPAFPTADALLDVVGGPRVAKNGLITLIRPYTMCIKGLGHVVWVGWG